MKNHTKVYFKHFNLAGNEFIPCECCGAKAVDIHHINARGMGGSKSKDDIENMVKESEKFLGFENLTLVPYCKQLIVKDMLERRHLEMIDDYYGKIACTLLPILV